MVFLCVNQEDLHASIRDNQQFNNMEEHYMSADHEDQQENREERDEHRVSQKWENPNPYTIPFAIVLAGVIIASAIVFTQRNNNVTAGKNAAQAGDTVQTATDYKSLEANAPAMLGNPAAPVAIVEFADYQCPFCGRFYQGAAKDIIEKYVKTGKARLYYRDFAFLGDESAWAAQAARCAGDQGKYWQYHDYLFTHQNGENEGAFTKDHLKSFAREMGLNSGEFATCLDSGKHAQEVISDTEIGRKFGVTGTPTSFVNGKIVQGAVPFSQFEPVILEALKAK